VTTWSTACPDWERRIVAGESLIPFPPLFQSEADEALGVFGDLRMVDATGSPLMRETVKPWVLEFVGAIFGAYDPQTGRRLVNEFLLLISKKNGKSTIAAGVMLTALVLNWRQSGEFIILAPTKEVADNSYKPIRDMIKADDDLTARFQVQDYFRTVTDRENGATLKVVAADSDTVSGKKAIGVFVDELHEFGKQAKAANMLLEATGGLTSRPEGFVIYATTQSEDPPAGVFKEKLSYARKVRDGEVEDRTFLPVLYEFPAAMVKAGAHRMLENAYVTNPNWGVSVDIPYMEKKHKQSQESEGDFRLFLAKHLNVEIGLNLRSDRWPGADYWQRQAVRAFSFEDLIERCEVAVAGIDGGGLDDLLGLTVIGREKVTRKWLWWSHAWAHEIVLERRKEIAPRLQDFEKAGELTFVAMPGQDVEEVADRICQLKDAKLLPEKLAIGVDAAGIGDILDALTTKSRGITEDQIIGISQGYKLQAAIKTCERKLAGEEIVHAGTGLMAWCVGNARVEQKGNAILITKQASGTAKIDPLMAGFSAVSLMALNPGPPKRSFKMHVIG